MKFLILLLPPLLFSVNLPEFSGEIDNSTSVTLKEKQPFSNEFTFRLNTYIAFYNTGTIEASFLMSPDIFTSKAEEGIRENSFYMNKVKKYIDDKFDFNPGEEKSNELYEKYNEHPFINNDNYDFLSLDRAVVSFELGSSRLFLGKQIIERGYGYAYTPSDSWNRKSPFDAAAPNRGLASFRYQYLFTDENNFNFIASPGKDLYTSTTGADFHFSYNDFRSNISVTRKHNPDRLKLNLSPLFITGFGFRYKINEDLNIINDFAFLSILENDAYKFKNNYIQNAAGFDYTPDIYSYLVIEYYYNGLGKDADYTINEIKHYISGDMAGLAKNYLYFGGEYIFAEKFVPGVYNILNLNDNSLIIMPEFEWRYHENFSLEIKSSIFTGDRQKDEYGIYHNTIKLGLTGRF